MLISMNGSPADGRGRVGVFMCECGCSQTFFRTIKTRHPKYINKTHRARAYRARARARAYADYQALILCDMYEPEDWEEDYAVALQEERFRNRGRL
jgi:hypothetical protein